MVARAIEAGAELPTFFKFPKAMQRGSWLTNPLKNINREFCRWTKTQASFGREHATVMLLHDLVSFGEIRMHKTDRPREFKALAAKMDIQAA